MFKGNNTAVVSRAALKYKLGKWRVYDVIFTTKRATLITDYEIVPRYQHLYRVSNYIFIGLSKHEGGH